MSTESVPAHEPVEDVGGEGLAPDQLADRLARLQHLTGELSRAATVREVADTVLTTGLAELDAAEAWVCLFDEASDSLEVVAHHGAVSRTVEQWTHFPRRAPLPVNDALDRDELVVWASLVDRDRAYPQLRGAAMANGAYVIAPLRADDVEVGGLVVGFARAGPISDPDQAFVRAVAHHTAQAVRRAQLYEDHRRALERQRFLAEAGLLLAESLDYERVLRDVAELAVPTLADGCVLHLYDEAGLKPVASAHADSGKRRQLEALVARQPVLRDPYVLRVAETGEPLVMPRVTAALRAAASEDAQHRELLHAFGVTSAIAVALTARGHCLGTLVLLSHDPARPLGAAQRTVAEDLAARAALAIDNARLHRQQQQLSEQLQHALGSRVVIEQAKGYLAARHGTSPEEAFERLRRQARGTCRRVHDVAAEVIAGRTDIV